MAAVVALTAAACSGGGEARPLRRQRIARPAASSPAGTPRAATPQPAADPAPRRVDPRKGGFEIGFGEFAVTLEADAIRPGPVTFEVTNGGKLVHGFEMKLGDSSGPGSSDGFEIERPTFGPGETIRFRMDLSPGSYEIECYVAEHDDLGMETRLEVRPGAPLVRVERPDASSGAVMISGFAFEPPVVDVSAGTRVTWMNHDPEEHTVTAEDGSFGSDPLASGQSFRFTFDEPGTYAYFCAIHPTMKGTVEVG